MLNTRTKKKHVRNKEIKKKRKTAKNRFVAGDGLLKATGQNIVSLGKNAINTAANPLTSFRKGANYLKNKGKFALTYLVNTSDLDRMIYKNSNFIHLVPTKLLNNIYYENEVKTGDSEIVYAAKKAKDTAIAVGTKAKETAIAVGTKAKETAIAVGTKTKETAIAVGTKAKETLQKINPINAETIAYAAATAAATKAAVEKGLDIATKTGAEALSSIWETINKKGKPRADRGDGRFEKTFSEIGKKLDNVQFDLDFDQQPGLTKPSMKKQTWIEATYDKSNVLNDVMNEVLTSETGYENATIPDVLGDYLREVEENLALIQNASSSSKKRKRKKGQEKQKKFMVIENEISKEQKFEISKGLLELLYDVVPEPEDTKSIHLKHVLIFLNDYHFNSKTFLENDGSPSKFQARSDIEYAESAAGGGVHSKKKKKKQKGGTIKKDGDIIVHGAITKLLNPEGSAGNNSCTIANGSDGKADLIMQDMKEIVDIPTFSVLFFDMEIWDKDAEQKMEHIKAILKENGIIVGDPSFYFEEWKLTATFRLKGFDDNYGIFVKQMEDLNLISGLDRVKPEDIIPPNAEENNDTNLSIIDNNNKLIETKQYIDVNNPHTTEQRIENSKRFDSTVEIIDGNNQISTTTTSKPAIGLADKVTETGISIFKSILEDIQKNKKITTSIASDSKEEINNNTNVNESLNNTNIKTDVVIDPTNNNNDQVITANINDNNYNINTIKAKAQVEKPANDQVEKPANDPIIADDDQGGDFTPYSDGIIIGGDLIPWSIFKKIDTDIDEAKNKQNKQNKPIKPNSKTDTKSKKDKDLNKLTKDLLSDEDLKALIKPLVLRDRITENINFLEILAEIIKKGKEESCSDKLKKIIPLLNIQNTNNNELNKEIEKNNKKSILFQRYISRNKNKTNDTTNKSKITQNNDTYDSPSQKIITSLKKIKSIYELQEEVKSYYRSLLEEIKTNTPPNTPSNTLTDLDDVNVEDIEDSSTKINKYFKTYKTHQLQFDNAIYTITNKINELTKKLTKLQTQNQSNADFIKKQLKEYQTKYEPSTQNETLQILSQGVLTNRIFYPPFNNTLPVDKVKPNPNPNILEKYKKVDDNTKNSTSISRLFESIKKQMKTEIKTETKTKTKIDKEKKNELNKQLDLDLLNSPPKRRFLPLLEEYLKNRESYDSNFQGQQTSRSRSDISEITGEKIYSETNSQIGTNTYNNSESVNSRPPTASSVGEMDLAPDRNMFQSIDDQISIVLDDIRIVIDDNLSVDSGIRESISVSTNNNVSSTRSNNRARSNNSTTSNNSTRSNNSIRTAANNSATSSVSTSNTPPFMSVVPGRERRQ